MFLHLYDSFADDSNSSQPIRQIFSQEIRLANTPVTVTAWLETRQVYQQQALRLHVATENSLALGSLSASIRTPTQSAWTSPTLSISPSRTVGESLHHEWQIECFSLQTGVLDLPLIKLRLDGKSMAQHWISFPSLPIRVLPLPFYLPKEVIVGKSLTVVDASPDLPAWALVGDRLSRELMIETQAVQARSIVLPPVSGLGIQGLSPVLQEQDNRIRITQAWQIQDSGTWQVEDQHLWLFDPDTLKTTHLVIAGAQGAIIPVWLWRTMQTVFVIVLLVLLSWFLHFVRKWLKRHRYRQGVLACQDAHQLVQYLKRHYGYADTVTLSHKLPNTHPDYTAIVALEGMLFGQEPLYGERFIEIVTKIV
jgi:hypothetical protein